MTYILEPYDDALREILDKGVKKPNRTGVEAITIFGMQRRYNIGQHFPLLTGRKVWPKAIFAELVWVLSGSTNVKDLQALGSNIWTDWADPEFEKQHGFVSGSLGPVYGFQLRHFGGVYGNGNGGKEAVWRDQCGKPPPPNWDFEKRRNYNNHQGRNIYGADGKCQITYMMNLLKNDPYSRRNLFSLWNPHDLDSMRLAPCHYTYQLDVSDGKLSGHLTQRSCDFPIGVPANIQFYSAMTYMFAQQSGYELGEFIHSTNNSHIYINQVEGVEEYLARPKPDSPKMKLNKADDMFSYKVEDFEIQDYNPEPPIKIPVAV